MSATQTATRTGVRPGAPGAPGVPGNAPAAPAAPPPQGNASGVEYSKRPNAPPKSEESVPSAEWARWRLYKQRPEIKDNFPEYFPDVRRQLHERLEAESQAAKQQIPKPPTFKKRSLTELKKGYVPTRLGFAPLTDFYDEADRQNARLSRRQRLDSDAEGDRIPSVWFERMAHDLFARVWDFCEETFGLISLGCGYNRHDWTLRWLDKLPREFVVLASQVARGDMTVVNPKVSDPNNWEFLFLDHKSRVKLTVGVMAKLLEKNVFNSLLFGAAHVEKQALTADDQARSFLNNSYQRNRTRSETVRNYIHSTRAPLGIGLVDLFTDNFWPEVDSVTMGILDLLLPMINLLGQEDRGAGWPPLKDVHQRLHDIVAEAAWFTNGMRATKSVFWIQFPIPGELNDISHEHATDDIWKRSKVQAIHHDRNAVTEWEAERDANITKNHPGEAITEARRRAYEADNPRPYIRRTAKVQVAMWPFIKRYTPARERDPGDGAYNTGETITHIMKAQTVYYYGDDADEADMRERRTLGEQISSRRWAKWFNWHACLLYALVAILFLLVTSPAFHQGLDSQPWAIRPSPSGREFLNERKTTTTVVAVPVGTEIVKERIVVVEAVDGANQPSKRWSEPRAPSVSEVKETVTETMVGKFDDEVDDNGEEDDYYGSGSHSHTGSDDDDGGFASAKEGIAAKIASAKDKAEAGIASGKDKIASGFSSTMERLSASLSSENERVASIKSSASESVKTSVADKTSRDSAASQSSASERNRSKAASRSSASEAREASRISDIEARAASKISAEESSSSSRSSTSKSKAASRRSALESRESSRSSVASAGSTEAGRSTEPEGITSAERSATSESGATAEERIATRLAAEEAIRVAASIVSGGEKARGSGTASKKHVHSRKGAPEDDGIDRTTVDTDAQLPVSVVDATESNSAVPVKKDMETVTITVPADRVVVTVTGPATQVETKGAVKKVAEKGTSTEALVS